MVPESSMWHAEIGYQYFDTLTSEDIAWEALRRNPDYQSDFKSLVKCKKFGARQAEICNHWGLRFRGIARSYRSYRDCLLGNGSWHI